MVGRTHGSLAARLRGTQNADLPAGELHDAENIMVELSADGKSGKLFIVTNRDRRLLVAADAIILSQLRRQLNNVFS
jgi:hypothetical protein